MTPPGVGIDGWFNRVIGTIRRSWRSLSIIILITQALPMLALELVSLWSSLPMGNAPVGQADRKARITLEASSIAQVVSPIALVLGSVLAIALLQSAGYAAGSWLMVREAAGAPASIGEALRFGARRMVGLSLWTLLYGLIVGLGACLCVLPGVYFALALALFGPVYLFERSRVMERSWRLFHDGFGPALGRLALLGVATFGLEVLVAMLQELVGMNVDGSAGSILLSVSLALVGALMSLPVSLILLVGLVVTYAERRAAEGPLNTGNLVQDLS